jgi:hypothetical protein
MEAMTESVPQKMVLIAPPLQAMTENSIDPDLNISFPR